MKKGYRIITFIVLIIGQSAHLLIAEESSPEDSMDEKRECTVENGLAFSCPIKFLERNKFEQKIFEEEIMHRSIPCVEDSSNLRFSVETWLDLGSQVKLLVSDKRDAYSPSQIHLKALSHKSFALTTNVDPSLNYTGTLYEWLSKKQIDRDLKFKILSAIAKTIVAYGPEIKDCSLHPKEIYMTAKKGKLGLASLPQNDREQNNVLIISKHPQEAFAYLMFYVLFFDPDKIEQFDKNKYYINKKRFCCTDSQTRRAIPVRFDIYNSKLLPREFLFIKKCAIKLFYGKISLEEISVCLAQWENFLCLESFLEGSLYFYDPLERKKKREYVSQFKCLIPIIFKIEPWLSLCSLWLKRIEEDSEEDFTRLLKFTEESGKAAKTRLAKLLIRLYEIISFKKGTATTIPRLERLWEASDIMNIGDFTVYVEQKRAERRSRQNENAGLPTKRPRLEEGEPCQRIKFVRCKASYWLR